MYSTNTFSNTKQKHVCWKFVKSERLLAVLREHPIFNVKWVEAHNMSDVFERTVLWNKSSFSLVIVLALRLFARISEIIKKKTLMVSPGTCGWIFNCCMPAIIFSKKNSKYEILNHLYFGPSFLFCGTALGRFSQCWIFHLSSLANHFGRYLYAPPPNHRKAFYGPAEKGITTNKEFWNFIEPSLQINGSQNIMISLSKTKKKS